MRPLFQSNSVVTSPIGDHEPPALQAITLIHAYLTRSVVLGTSLRNTAITTIAAAKLSRKAESKNEAIATRQSRRRLLSVSTKRATLLKPP